MSDRSRRLGPLAAFIVAGISAGLALTTPGGGDWSCWWRASSIVARGASPYDLKEWLERGEPILDAITSTQCTPWLYPPLVGQLAAPLTALPIEVAYAVLRLGVTAGVIGGVVVASYVWTSDARSRSLVIVTAALSAPYVLTIGWTHFDGWLLLALALLARALERGSGVRTGLASLLLSLKPHLFLALAGAVPFVLVAAGRYAILARAAVVVGVPLAISLMFGGDYIRALVQWSASKQTVSGATLGSISGLTIGGLAVGGAIVAGIVTATLAAAYVAFRGVSPSNRTRELVPIAMAMSLTIAPYSQVYDGLLLVPLLATTVGHARSLSPLPRGLITAWSCGAFFFAGWLALSGFSFGGWSATWEGPVRMLAIVLPLALLLARAALKNKGVRQF